MTFIKLGICSTIGVREVNIVAQQRLLPSNGKENYAHVQLLMAIDIDESQSRLNII